MWLGSEIFRTIVATTPLISIDLVIQNDAGDILLGQRLNRPAQGAWFVPGGRILKGETLDAAFRRLTGNELGVSFERAEGRLLDIYEHFYEDSVFGNADTGPSTHYLVLGYQLRLAPGQTLEPPTIQHDRYRWWSISEMNNSVDVHANTRAYLAALR